MEFPEIGRRKQKKARQKFAIMEEFLHEMEAKELNEIRVEDVCAGLSISKVTFFNYFDSKEQVVEYYIYKWQYEMCAAIQSGNLSGRAALELIFTSVGDHPAGQRIMNAVMLFFLKQDRYVPMKISDFEYYLFDPEAYEKGVRASDLTLLFSQALESMGSPADARAALIPQLIAGFYGVALRAKIRGERNLAKAYAEFVSLLLPPQAAD